MTQSRSNRERTVSAVKHGIAEGRYTDGMLPSYRQLAAQLSVTVANVRQAMSQMEREGIIHREKRRGVFIRQKPPTPCSAERTSLRCVNFVFPSHPLAPFVYASYMQGQTEVLDGRDIRARHLLLAPDDHNFVRLLSPDHPMEAQGFVLVNCLYAALCRWLLERQVPYVIQNFARYNTAAMPEHHSIYVNKSGGAAQAVNHLLALGHRRVGFIGGAGTTDDPANRIFEGYRAAMDCRGLGCRESDLIHNESEDPAAVLPVIAQLLARPDRPTAVLTGNDNTALGVIQVARARQLRVPEDLSVIGFNDQPGVEKSAPPLTTVSVPRRQLAHSAVEMLLEMARGQCKFERRVLECHLIVRESTAPPAEPVAC